MRVLVLVASKRIRHNQIKTDKVGVFKKSCTNCRLQERTAV
jgi:hypothetical protein